MKDIKAITFNCHLTRLSFIFILKLLTFLFVLFLFVILIDISFSSVLLCDSISEVEVSDTGVIKKDSNLNTGNIAGSLETSTGLFLKYKNILKRKAYWYFNDKYSGKYNSYDDFKNSWNSNTSFRSDLKTTLNKWRKNPISSFKEDLHKSGVAAFERRSKIDALDTERFDMKRMARARFNKERYGSR